MSERPRAGALAPLVAIVAIDGILACRAWGSAGERIAVVLVSAALVVLVSCALTLFVAGLRLALHQLAPRHVARAPLIAAAPLMILLARRLGAGPVAQRLFGGWAALVLALGLALAWAAALHLARSANRLPRTILGLAAVGLFITNALLPLRMFPPLHLLCFAAALGSTLALADRGARIGRGRLLLAGLVAASAAAGSLRVSSNVRFVAHEQTPGAGVLLGLLEPGKAGPSVARPLAPLIASSLDASLADAHLVLISIDALRADALGSYGARRATPNLDALAHRALRYTRAYAQAPHTAYSMSSLLTSTPPERLQAASRTLPEVLRQHRWFTQAWYPDGLFFDGRGALSRFADERFGFAWTDTRTQDARGVTEAVLERIGKLREDGEPRSFLWIHYFDPHEPYEEHPGFTLGQGPRARYEGEIAYVDAQLGRLFAALDGLLRPVIIVVTADHGEEHGEHGGYYHGSSLYEEQVRVPLLLVAPGQTPRVIDDPVELLDVVPTVSSLLGVPTAATGRDLLAPTEEEAQPRDAHASVHTKRMLVRGRYKLIHDIHRDFDELYDLVADPGERRNLFEVEPEIAAPMHAALETWFGLSAPSELVQILEDRARDPLGRAAAAGELGRRATGEGREALARHLHDADARVATASALALGELHDPRARAPLLALLGAEEVSLRAAILLGRSGEVRALPTLLGALDTEHDVALRRTAIHVIGALGDEAAAQVLARHLVDVRTRSELYLAIGRIGARHPRAHLETLLLRHLRDEPYEDARAHLVWGLSLSGSGLETKPLLALARATSWPIALEGLTRSRNFPSEQLGGVDLAPGREALDAGLRACRRGQTHTLRQWTGASTCRMGERALLHLRLPRPGASTLILRARAERDTELELAFGPRLVARARLGPSYTETSVPIPAGLAEAGRGQLSLRAGPQADIELDYALLLPDEGEPMSGRAGRLAP